MPKLLIDKKSISLLLHCYFKSSEIEQEYKFDNVRKFKFDYAIPKLKLAIEYEGVVSAKSRHTSITGYTTDCEKYNLAIVNGWKVLRYTAINIHTLARDIEKYLELKLLN